MPLTYLPDDVRGVVDGLRRLRNEVAHGQRQITSVDALEYVQTVRRVVYDMLPNVPLNDANYRSGPNPPG